MPRLEPGRSNLVFSSCRICVSVVGHRARVSTLMVVPVASSGGGRHTVTNSPLGPAGGGGSALGRRPVVIGNVRTEEPTSDARGDPADIDNRVVPRGLRRYVHARDDRSPRAFQAVRFVPGGPRRHVLDPARAGRGVPRPQRRGEDDDHAAPDRVHRADPRRGPDRRDRRAGRPDRGRRASRLSPENGAALSRT